MEDAINQIEQEMRNLEAQLGSHPYRITSEDSSIVDGQQVFSDEYIANMPADYSMILGRFGAFEEARNIIEKAQAKEILNNSLGNFLSQSNPRFQIEFDDE